MPVRQVLTDKPKPVNELKPFLFDNMLYKIFVYGNLKTGLPLSGYLRKQKFLGEATTRPLYLLYDLGTMPGLVENIRDGININGELWEVDAKTMRILDRVEGEGVLYKRAEVKILTPNIDYKDTVWAYFFMGEVSDSLKCGKQWPNQSV